MVGVEGFDGVVGEDCGVEGVGGAVGFVARVPEEEAGVRLEHVDLPGDGREIFVGVAHVVHYP